MAATYRPDVLLLRTTRRIDPATCESLVEQMKGRGFVEIEPVQRPPRSDPVAVLVNRRRIAALALSAYR
jgi:hypothetical protein